MKAKPALICALAVILLSQMQIQISYTSMTVKQQPEDEFDLYALVVSGINPANCFPYEVPAYHRADMMYEALDYLRSMGGHIMDITYLTMNGSFGGLATPESVLNWIRGNANGLSMWDTLLVFYSGHGGGAFADGRIDTTGGRVDANGDEGVEHQGSFGVDECIVLMSDSENEATWQNIWDDDVNEALQYAICRTVVILNGCKEINSNCSASCHTGGFIDDLSKERRVIISSANETGFSYLDQTETYKGFVYYLIDAIRDKCTLKTSFDWAFACDEFRHYVDMWGNVYCWETPWLDDDGDRLPTFKYGSDYLDDDQGWFSSHVIVGENSGMLIGDINNNHIVSVSDVGIIMQYWDQAVTDPSEIWKRKADINGDWWVDILDVGILMMNWQKTI
jgi:hypothetical protein